MDKSYDTVQNMNYGGARTSVLSGQASAVNSVSKALLIIEELLQEERSIAARELAERCGINRSTVHRILNTLSQAGWVNRDPHSNTYRLSVRFLALMHVSNVTRDFLSTLRPELDSLSVLSREAIHVGVLEGFDVIHVEKIDSLEHVGVSSRIGSRGVTHRTSLGKALLANHDEEFVVRYIEQGKSRQSPFRVTSETDIWKAIHRTREEGYALDDEEDSIGVRCIGSAILGPTGTPLFAISITGPSPRFTRERALQLAPELMAVTENLSRVFGAYPDNRSVLGTDEQ